MFLKFKNIFTGKSLFAVKFLAIATIMFLVFYFGESSYATLIRYSVSAYYYFFKPIFGLQPPQHLYSNLLILQAVSFFALIVVTPETPLKRRVKFFAIGMIIFFITDLFFTALEISFQDSYVWIFLVTDFLKLALPISLWFVFSYNYLTKFVEEKLEKN